MPARLPSLVAATLVAWLALAASAHAVTIDFDTSEDYGANFHRTMLTTGSNNMSGYSASAQAYTHTATGSGTSVFVYDTAPDATPTNTFSSVSVDFDFSSSVNNVSFGVYFGGSSRTGANLAIFNLNTNGTNDTLRFFTGGSINGGGAGTQSGTTSGQATGAWTTNTTYHATLLIEYVGATTADVTYTISDPNNVLSSFSATASGLGVAEAGEIAFRSGFLAGGGTLTIDNISIVTSAVPEPSSAAALGGLAALGCVALRRRRRR